MNTNYTNATLGNVTANRIGQQTPGVDAKIHRFLAGLPGDYWLVDVGDGGSAFILPENVFTGHFSAVREAANT